MIQETNSSRLIHLEHEVADVLAAIKVLEEQVGALRTTVNEVNGVVKALRFASVLVTIALGVFAIAQQIS